MALPALVLVHGGAARRRLLGSDVAEIHRAAPDLAVLARRSARPSGQARRSAQRSASTTGSTRCSPTSRTRVSTTSVIVAHSLAGLTVPGVVTKLGSSRGREMVFAAAFVPPRRHRGRRHTARAGGVGTPAATHTDRQGRRHCRNLLAEFVFCNGMTRQQRRFSCDRFYAGVAVRSSFDNRRPLSTCPTTCLGPGSSRCATARFRWQSQRRSIAALGGVQTVIPLDTCHDLMVSEPELLATILVERCRRYA